MNAILRRNALIRSFVMRREWLIYIVLLVVSLTLALYNLEYSPRTWQDEGGTLSLARTLVEDGVYAIRNSDGYQTFGTVQSVGPTVVLPIALSFKLFGVGLLQARLVMSLWLIVTLFAFYSLGRELFGMRSAALAVLLILSFPFGLVMLGRQALGEVPGICLLLAGSLAWIRAIRASSYRYYALTGLLFGLAMITKSQYIVMIGGTLILCAPLTIWYFKRSIKPIAGIIFIAFTCVVLWTVWQIMYFGIPTFQENAGKMSSLAKVTAGLNPSNTIIAVKYILGPASTYFYYFLGFPALIYIGFGCLQRNEENIVTCSLLIFTLLCLAYYIFWIIPVPIYALAPMTITAFFVAKLLSDIIPATKFSLALLRKELREHVAGPMTRRIVLIISIGGMLSFLIGTQVSAALLDNDTRPQEFATVLNQSVADTAVIETWERELGSLTSHKYHYPDQSVLQVTQAERFLNTPHKQLYGEAYFKQFHAEYLVIGWYGRYADIYDSNYLRQHACLLSTIGSNEWRYELYHIDLLQAHLNQSDHIQPCLRAT
ncbi:MAG: glycosyltransferase family 39 protein [Roseiflexaceae bacterium]